MQTCVRMRRPTHACVDAGPIVHRGRVCHSSKVDEPMSVPRAKRGFLKEGCGSAWGLVDPVSGPAPCPCTCQGQRMWVPGAHLETWTKLLALGFGRPSPGWCRWTISLRVALPFK